MGETVCYLGLQKACELATVCSWVDGKVISSMDTGTVSSERPATDAVGDAASLVTSVFCKDAPSSRSSQSTADPNKNATVGRGCGTSDSRKELYSNGDQRSQCRGSVCVLLSSEAHFFRSNTENETGGSGVSSRNYVAEAGVSFEALLAAQEAAVSCGYTLSFVTVSGNPPPISSFTDVENLKARLPHCSGTSDKHILEQQEALIHLIQTPQRLRSASADEFVCLLVPHHLGACLDLMHSASTAAFLEAFRNQNKPIGAIGHGIFAFFAKNKSRSHSGGSTFGFPDCVYLLM